MEKLLFLAQQARRVKNKTPGIRPWAGLMGEIGKSEEKIKINSKGYIVQAVVFFGLTVDCGL
jgi:hypothetical protein